MNKSCQYVLPDQGGSMICGQDATHVCLVERIGEEGAQSGGEDRCQEHAKRCDVVDAWTFIEAGAWEI